MAKKPQTQLFPARDAGGGTRTGEAGSGGAERFEASVLSHIDAAYTLARYLTRRGDAAEDIVQEALLRAYRGFAGHRGENMRAWLLTIVRNCFLTWNARSRPASGDSNSSGEGELESSRKEDGHEAQTPESILIQNEEAAAIRAVVEGLPHPFREVLVLRDIEDISYREIAEITGVPIGTVMSRLARARKMFAAAWTGAGFETSKEMQR
jgi:RNA polymerase sigma factor (sigma-70 family)